jgi:hypothetical protein
MRNAVLAVALAVVLAVPGAAAAEARGDAVTGVYEVKYDDVGNTCTQGGISLLRGTIEVKVKKGRLHVEIDRVAGMTGAPPGPGGKLKAASKLGPSTIDGLDGRFSVSGRVSDGMLQLVFVAEYFHKRRPYCTQSWNVSGLRQSELEKKRTARP